ncbi:MAG TPA: EAL domain-containing protein [Gallionella sp.]|nr:EAL domain-containing protein [Gallionella sp.]
MAVRIKRAAFVMTMFIIVLLGSLMLVLTLLEIPGAELNANQGNVNFIGEVLSVDFKNQLGSVERLSRSSLVWTALTDSAGREAYLRPFLQDQKDAGNIPMHLLDYRGRPVLGEASAAIASGQLQALVGKVLADKHSRYAVIPNAGHPVLVGVFPVIFPYTHDAIGALVGEVDVFGTFHARADGLGSDFGLDMLHQGHIIVNHAGAAPAIYFPAYFDLDLGEAAEGGALTIKLYSTSNPWLAPVIKRILLSALLAVFLGVVVWRISGVVARRLSLRLNALADACVAIAESRATTIPEDAGRDEIGVLSRTLHNAIESYEEINSHLEELVEEKTRKLSESEARFRSFFENNSSVMLLIEPWSGKIIDANRAAASYYGYPRERMSGMHRREIDAAAGMPVVGEAAPVSLEEKQHVISQHRLASGELRDVEVHSTPIASGDHVLLFVIVHDITERKQSERDIRIAAAAFETQEGILITDAAGLILRVNGAFSNITGYSMDEVVGKSPSILGSGRQDHAFYEAMWASLNNTGTWAGEIWNRRKNGTIYPEYLTISSVKDGDGNVTNYVAAFSDITVSKLAEDEIKSLAFFDPLTRLPNRRLLMDRLRHALSGSMRSKHQCALMFIDLDHFKSLNDTLGHDIGDLLLQQVAQRLQDCVREGDTVARQGGDEFVVMLEELSSNTLEAAKQAEMVGEKILAALNQPYQLAGHKHRNSPSIGITLFDGEQADTEELFKQADIAMYQSKKAGRNTLSFFDPVMQATVTARVTLESDLRRAVIEQEEFQLYYQVQVDASGRRVGVEALIRWNHPERGMVSPAEFIPLAEESGLILPLGHWVLATACKQLHNWAARPETAHLTMSVNISARQFRLPTFVEEVLALVDHFGLDPKRLKLEITESMLAHNVDEIIGKMIALKARGISFSMDDFGTGYSSLQYLKRLPLAQLKIDQSFVRDIAVDESDRAIVRTIIAMAQSLDLDIIAEGVETEEQRQLLLEKGCNTFQGYLFGKPEPIDRFDV